MSGDDPIAAAVIEALARRAAAQQGPARQALLQRVDALRAAQAGTAAAAAALPPAPRTALAGLSELVDRLGRGAVTSPRSAATGTAPLRAVTAFRGTWSRLRAEQRLRQAVAQVPAMAGPLNSSHVVNRTLQALRELSPDYLYAFMSQVDTLLWLEQASGAGELAPRPAAAKSVKAASGPRRRP